MPSMSSNSEASSSHSSSPHSSPGRSSHHSLLSEKGSGGTKGADARREQLIANGFDVKNVNLNRMCACVHMSANSATIM